MNTSLVLAGLFTSFAIVACSVAPVPEEPGDSEQRVSNAPTGEEAPAAKGDGGAAGPETEATGPKEKGEPTPQEPADPICVASCESGGLAAKCGDTKGGFCESVCGSRSATLVACLVAAPDCAKTQWIRCRGDAGTGTK